MELKGIISGFAALAPGLKAIHALIKESRGQRCELLRELQQNINRIAVYLESGDPAQLDKVILGLETARYEAASGGGFDFNGLKKGKLAPETVRDVPQFQRYVGLSTEALFDKLHAWIHALKLIAADYPHNTRLRKQVRLINIFKLMLLLARHVRS